RADRVERRGEIGERIQQDRDVALGQLARNRPGFLAAGDHRAHAVRACKLERAPDISGPGNVEYDSSTVEIASERLAPERTQQRAILRRRARARFVNRLLEQHPLSGAAAAGERAHLAAEIDEQ